MQIVERIAASLMAKYNTEATNPRVAFVRLTGLLHTEERAAFKEIARQLCRLYAALVPLDAILVPI